MSFSFLFLGGRGAKCEPMEGEQVGSVRERHTAVPDHNGDSRTRKDLIECWNCWMEGLSREIY